MRSTGSRSSRVSIRTNQSLSNAFKTAIKTACILQFACILSCIPVIASFSSPTLVSFVPDADANASQAIVASLDITNQRINFKSLLTNEVSWRDETIPIIVESWNPIVLDANGASAIAAGTLVASSGLLASSAMTNPLPFLAVASGRTIKLYSAIARINSSTDADPIAIRSFAIQPLLILASSAAQMNYQIQSQLCVCRMQIVPNTDTQYTTVYLSDSLGNLSMLRLNQSRVSSGNSDLPFAWMVESERIMVQVEHDRANGNTSATLPSSNICPPCEGDAIVSSGAASTPTSGKLWYAPRSTVVRSNLLDIDADGLKDYIVVRASTDPTTQMMSLTDLRNQIGMEILIYKNDNSSNSAGVMKLMQNTITVLSPTTSSGLYSSKQQGINLDQETLLNQSSHVRLHTELRGRSWSRLNHYFTQTSMTQMFAAAAAAPASSTTTVSDKKLVVRLPDSIELLQADQDATYDLLISFREFINGSTQLSSSSSVGSMPSILQGVLCQSRLLTLFGSASAGSTRNTMFSFKFSSSTSHPSISDVLPATQTFLASVSLLPSSQGSFIGFRSQSGSSTTIGFSPLLSSLIDVSTLSLFNDFDLLTPDAVAILNPMTLVSLPASTTNLYAVDLGFPLYPTRTRVITSDFFEPNSSTTTLKLYQQSSLIVVAQGIGRSSGSMREMHCDSGGVWIIPAPMTLNLTAEALDDPFRFITAQERMSTWSLDADSSVDLSLLSNTIQDDGPAAAFIPSMEVGPHSALILSPSGRVMLIQSHEIDVLPGGAASSQSTVGSAVSIDNVLQMFYSMSQRFDRINGTFNATEVAMNIDLQSSPELQSALLLSHDLRVVDSVRRSGWSQAVQLDIAPLDVEFTRNPNPSKWDEIIDSPITWTLLALIGLCLAFCCWLSYRHRVRRMHQRGMRDLNDILNEPVPTPQYHPLPSFVLSQAALEHPYYSSSSMHHHSPSNGEISSNQIIVAPPNSMNGSLNSHNHVIIDSNLQPDGVLLHQRVFGESETKTAQSSLESHSSASTSPNANTAPTISMNLDSPKLTTDEQMKQD